MAVTFIASAMAEKIGSIVYEQNGNYKFPDAMLQFNVQSRVGEKFNDKTLNDDIKRLYGTGFFSDVVAESQKAKDDKVAIVFRLKPKSLIREIIFQGNKKFPTEDLKKEITLESELPLNDVKLRESANKLRTFYRGKGYNEATVMPEIKHVTPNEVKVIFQIDEHLRLKVNNVTFEGNTLFSSWDLKNSLANRHSFFSRFFDMGLYDPNQLDLDKVRLREMYWNKGYLDFKVEKVTVTPDPSDPEYVNINYQLFEGKPYKVNKVTISGCKKFTPDKLLKCIVLKKGEVFEKTREDKSKDNIEFEYAVLGYADFACRVNRYPDFQTHLVDIDFAITEGIPYKVQDVNIKGNRVTKDKVLRRELVVQPGDPVDKNRIEASKSRLMGMGYFKDVKAVTVNDEESGKKDVNFTVEEKSNFEFKIGGGYSDTDSLVGMLSLTNNNFDITDPDHYFQGGGQRLRAQAMFGLTRSDFSIDFTEPWLMDIPLKLDVGAYLNDVAYRYWNEQRAGGKVGLSKKFFDDFLNISAGYKFEQVYVHNMNDSLCQELEEWAGKRDLVSQPSLEVSRDTRDSLMNPTTGYFANLFASVSPKVLGSTHDFYRLESKGSYYMHFLDKALIWHNGARVGTVSSFNRDDKAPLYERYFLGGGDTIRGFEYRRVSPLDDNDECIGGQTMLILTSEVTHPIWRFIRGAIFVDAGNAWTNSYSMGFDQMNVGAGYGLRMQLPMINAPIKLDLAYPIIMGQTNSPRKLQFHFNMGFTW